ncbi:hypothetical protein MLD38_033619 [Melastoma candidum]|uniref:Uncharacterized protein n=1 Tax=Melastoma candidum TaxID=119954 RepID=A0ACB9M7C3_9MYRT|nr:hypothetical protein MLD38_033619 [Melastoma candidum]
MITVAPSQSSTPQDAASLTSASAPAPAPTPDPGRIFRSKLPDITITNHLSLHDYCFHHLPDSSDRPCLLLDSSSRSFSYSETYLVSRRVSAGLHNLGIRQGDVIMTLLPNCTEFVFSFMGASMIGAVTTTANPFYTPAEILKQLKASGAKLIVTQSQHVDKLRSFSDIDLWGDHSSFPVVTTDDPPENCLHFSVLSEANEEDAPKVDVDPDSPAALPFSSGTTGLPKGVILTHRNLITSIAQQVDGENPNLYLTKDDVVMCVLPLFHIYSLNSVLLCALRAGAKVLLMKKFEIGPFLELIERHRVTVAAVVPPLVIALTKNQMVEKYDLTSIRVVLSGAAPLGKELVGALHARLPQATLGQGYGMTEAGPVLSMSLGFAKEPFPTKFGSCGTVVRNAELKVIDPETGVSLGYNQTGEICIRGQQIMKGYLNDEKATASTIDVDGWLHTGDIGYVDEDEEIFIVDRVKEIIKFKGFQVPPAELEALLISHPSIEDAAVVPQKDEVAGEVPVAFVVRSNGFELTEEAVKEFISKQVVFYKRLHRVCFVHAIPKSPSGKILRKELRAKIAAANSAA